MTLPLNEFGFLHKQLADHRVAEVVPLTYRRGRIIVREADSVMLLDGW